MTTLFRLREILEAHEMTQAALAKASGVSLPTISRLCRNETAQVSLSTLDKLATALKVEPGELIVREKKGRR
jgi:transcriptional regulator with XRE-family HTH domain